MKFYLTFVVCWVLSIKNLHAQSIVGKWECETITYHITKQDGATSSMPNKIKEKGVSIIWEFSSNGKFSARQDKLVQEGTWEMKGNQLLLKGDFTKQIAEGLGMKDLIYEVEQKENRIDFSVDVTKTGSYKKHILTYTYTKL